MISLKEETDLSLFAATAVPTSLFLTSGTAFLYLERHEATLYEYPQYP
jgi:hypothetical protein